MPNPYLTPSNDSDTENSIEANGENTTNTAADSETNANASTIVDASDLLSNIVGAPLASAGNVSRNLNWYRASLDDVQTHMGELVDFANWLTRTNRLFDQALPSCWIHHPWIVMIIDSLLNTYQEAYLRGKFLFRHQFVLNVVPDAIRNIQSYASNFGLYEHQHVTTCPMQDDYDMLRDNFTEQFPHHVYTPAWPWDETSAQEAIYHNEH